MMEQFVSTQTLLIGWKVNEYNFKETIMDV